MASGAGPSTAAVEADRVRPAWYTGEQSEDTSMWRRYQHFCEATGQPGRPNNAQISFGGKRKRLASIVRAVCLYSKSHKVQV